MKTKLTLLLLLAVFKGFGQDYLKTRDSITQRIKPQCQNIAFAIDTTTTLVLTGHATPVLDFKNPAILVGYVVGLGYSDKEGHLKKAMTIDQARATTYYYQDNYYF